MNKKDPILFSYVFDSEGKGQKLSNEQASGELKRKGLAWVHLDAANKNSQEWIKKEVNYLDHLIIDALTAEETRPRVIEFEEGFLIILRGVNLNKDAEAEDMVSIRIWIDNDRIISLQRRDMKAVFNLRDQIEQGKTIKTSSEFLYNLIFQILSDTSSFLNTLGDKIDILEEKVSHTHNTKFRGEVLDVRSKAAIFKRYLMPQKEAIAQIKSCQHKWINAWAKRHFQENLNQITMMIEEIDEVQNRAGILNDELFNGLTEKINKSMYGLSLIASVFIPLTFFTSILSVNIAGIPGAKNDQAFWWMIFILGFLTLLQLILFKKKNLL